MVLSSLTIERSQSKRLRKSRYSGLQHHRTDKAMKARRADIVITDKKNGVPMIINIAVQGQEGGKDH